MNRGEILGYDPSEEIIFGFFLKMMRKLSLCLFAIQMKTR